MPEFEVLPRHEAMMTSSTGKRSQVIREYSTYIERLGRDEAGKITPSTGETVATIRRRLGAAVRTSGKSIQIKRVGNDIYFWEDPPKRRGGRPRKNPEA
jgi:hypothetical protein